MLEPWLELLVHHHGSKYLPFHVLYYMISTTAKSYQGSHKHSFWMLDSAQLLHQEQASPSWPKEEKFLWELCRGMPLQKAQCHSVLEIVCWLFRFVLPVICQHIQIVPTLTLASWGLQSMNIATTTTILCKFLSIDICISHCSLLFTKYQLSHFDWDCPPVQDGSSSCHALLISYEFAQLESADH